MVMRIGNSNASKTLAREAMGHCSWCGNPVEWRDTFDFARIPLLPGEFPARRIPAPFRWHLDGGIAYPGVMSGTPAGAG